MLRSMVNNTVTLLKNIQNSASQVDCFASQMSTKLDVEVNRIVWVDLEMTGLDVTKDTIMEVACIITDSNLNIVAEGPDIIIHHDENALNNMNEWCKVQHGKSGLSDACLRSNVNIKEAENEILDFLTEYVPVAVSPLAGNSVYMDRLFLKKYMPKVDKYLHYRIVDVSTIKELCRRWNPEVYSGVPKKNIDHRALADLKESVEELKYYKNSFFKIPEP